MARTSTIERNTNETKIKLALNLDGTGKADIDSGVGFFDHMMNGFTRHGLFDVDLKVKGDLEVDCHHTIEDTGIVLGNAIREAVGDKKGIKRYGSCILPMDEALVLCAVDLCCTAPTIIISWKRCSRRLPKRWTRLPCMTNALRMYCPPRARCKNGNKKCFSST